MFARPQGACWANADGAKQKNANAPMSLAFVFFLMVMRHPSRLRARLRSSILPCRTMPFEPEPHRLYLVLLVGDDFLRETLDLLVSPVEQNKRLAQEIIADQQNEIELMR